MRRAVLVLTTVMLAATCGVADAAKDSSSSNVTQRALAHIVSNKSGATPDTQGTVCYDQINYPHNSTHSPGYVNVEGTTKCDGFAPGIWQTIILSQNGIPVSYKYNYQIEGGTYAADQTETRCAPAEYSGEFEVWIPGFTPEVVHIETPTVLIKEC